MQEEQHKEKKNAKPVETIRGGYEEHSTNVATYAKLTSKCAKYSMSKPLEQSALEFVTA